MAVIMSSGIAYVDADGTERRAFCLPSLGSLVKRLCPRSWMQPLEICVLVALPREIVPRRHDRQVIRRDTDIRHAYVFIRDEARDSLCLAWRFDGQWIRARIVRFQR